MKYSIRCQEDLMEVSDSRISQVSELLTNIKFLKLYSWESIFKGKANNVRGQV